MSRLKLSALTLTSSLLVLLCQAIALDLKSQTISPNLVFVQHPRCISHDSVYYKLQYPGDSSLMHGFYYKLSQVRHTGVNVLHIGDSHIQGGEISQTIRTRLADNYAVGDRGMLFPFRAIKTNSPAGYKIFSTGRWTSSRIVNHTQDVGLGLTGCAAITSDSTSSLFLTLRDGGKWSFTRLTIIGNSSDSTVRPVLLANLSAAGGAISKLEAQRTSCGWFFTINEPIDSCMIRFEGLGKVLKAPVATRNNPRPKSNYFPLDSLHYVIVRGILPSSDRIGITYTGCGVNGATVSHWLRTSNRLEEDLKLLRPDLIICSLATNDANVPPVSFDTATYKENYRQLIARIRSVNPSAVPLFVSGNDCWINVRNMRRQPNPNTKKAREAIRELAREYGAPFFDLFGLMGGQGSADRWVSQGLMRRDHIHFTENGYHIVGNLIYNAIVSDYLHWQASDSIETVSQQ